jgi:UDP-N-acetylenolpyruvoylglucosamine reductase
MKNILKGHHKHFDLMNYTEWDYENSHVNRDDKTMATKVKFKYDKSVKQEIYSKINFLTSMKMVEGILFIKLKMK